MSKETNCIRSQNGETLVIKCCRCNLNIAFCNQDEIPESKIVEIEKSHEQECRQKVVVLTETYA